MYKESLSHKGKNTSKFKDMEDTYCDIKKTQKREIHKQRKNKEKQFMGFSSTEE